MIYQLTNEPINIIESSNAIISFPIDGELRSELFSFKVGFSSTSTPPEFLIENYHEFYRTDTNITTIVSNTLYWFVLHPYAFRDDFNLELQAKTYIKVTTF